MSKGKLLVCGYNLNLDSPVARQLKYSLLHYMTQSNFNPSYSIEIDTLKKMFAYTPKAMVSVPKGFENSLYIMREANEEFRFCSLDSHARPY